MFVMISKLSSPGRHVGEFQVNLLCQICLYTESLLTKETIKARKN